MRRAAGGQDRSYFCVGPEGRVGRWVKNSFVPIDAGDLLRYYEPRMNTSETKITPNNCPDGGRVVAQIAKKIRKNYLGSVSKEAFLPTERELAEQYSAARNTIRRALALLADQALIRAERSRGYRILTGASLHEKLHRIAVLQAAVASDRYRGRAVGEVVEAVRERALGKKWQVLGF